MSPDGSGLYLPAQAEELPQSEELRIESTCVVLVPIPQMFPQVHTLILVNPSNVIWNCGKVSNTCSMKL